MDELKIDNEWDKVFEKSNEVEHKKVNFMNHFGINIVADMYIPKKNKGSNNKFSAIAVSGPFGAVKEQSSGLYAQELAKRGFLTIAFDPSFTGESDGKPRYMNSPDINTEDFLSAVDFLSNLDNVDENKIGIIGICGWGGYAINTASIDTRIKATVASTMYDMSRVTGNGVTGNGYNDIDDSEEARYKLRESISRQRTIDYKENSYKLAGGVVDPLPSDAPDFVRDYYNYYKTKRGYHKRSLNSNDGWCITAQTSLLNTRILHYSNEIRSAVLIIHGNRAHSLYFGRDAYNNMISGNKYTDNKELIIIPDATHVDLYDNMEKIPFDKIEEFFKKYLR